MNKRLKITIEKFNKINYKSVATAVMNYHNVSDPISGVKIEFYMFST